MDSLTINKILMKNQVTRGDYLGCFAADQIPSQTLLKYPCSMVINESPAKEMGSHWVAIYAPNNDTVYYFDSYADEPNNFLKNYLSRYKKIYKNKKSLQDQLSIVCGQYCIYVLYMLSKKNSFFDVLKKLYSSGFPDLYVKLFVDKLINNV
jgi:hypothetical protein